MNERSKSHRRDFLFGRSAVKAARDKAESLLGDSETEAGNNSHDPGLSPKSHYLLEFSRRAMACDFQVLLPPETPPEGPEWAVEALEYLEEIEDRWSVYRDHSLMSLVNRTAFERAVPVNEDLFELLSLGKRLHELTGGAFDMTSGPLTKAWGFYRAEGRMPQTSELESAIDSVGSQYVTMDETERTVRYQKAGVDINLGGIGKGYALDLCVERMGWNGLTDFLFHGGQSSVVARGHRHPSMNIDDENGWRIGVIHPIWPGKRLLDVQLSNEALGTSGTSRQHFYHRGERFGHIFDPRSGRPAMNVLSSTVIAPSAAEADALATAFYVMGPEEALEFCERHTQYGMIMVIPGRNRQSIALHTANLPETKWRRLLD